MKFKVGDKVKVVRNDVNRQARDAIIGGGWSYKTHRHM